jgi:hypothetical protein
MTKQEVYVMDRLATVATPGSVINGLSGLAMDDCHRFAWDAVLRPTTELAGCPAKPRRTRPFWPSARGSCVE